MCLPVQCQVKTTWQPRIRHVLRLAISLRKPNLRPSTMVRTVETKRTTAVTTSCEDLYRCSLIGENSRTRLPNVVVVSTACRQTPAIARARMPSGRDDIDGRWSGPHASLPSRGRHYGPDRRLVLGGVASSQALSEPLCDCFLGKAQLQGKEQQEGFAGSVLVRQPRIISTC